MLRKSGSTDFGLLKVTLLDAGLTQVCLLSSMYKRQRKVAPIVTYTILLNMRTPREGPLFCGTCQIFGKLPRLVGVLGSPYVGFPSSQVIASGAPRFLWV